MQRRGCFPWIGVLIALATAFFQVPRLRAQEDAELEAITAKYASARTEAQARARAAYADELHALKERLAAAGNTSAISQVDAELDATMKELEPSLAPPEDPKLSETTSSTPPPRVSGEELDSIFSDKKPPHPAEEPAGNKSPAPVTLLPQSAKIREDCELNQTYFNTPGSTATWTLTDLPPGDYKIVAHYTTPDGSGGKAQLRVGDAPSGLVFSIEPGEGTLTKQLAALNIEACPLDISLEALEIYQGTPGIFNLIDLVVIPQQAAAHREEPAKSPREDAPKLPPSTKPTEPATPGKGGLFDF